MAAFEESVVQALIDLVTALVVAVAAAAFAHFGLDLSWADRSPRQEREVERVERRSEPDGREASVRLVRSTPSTPFFTDDCPDRA